VCALLLWAADVLSVVPAPAAARVEVSPMVFDWCCAPGTMLVESRELSVEVRLSPLKASLIADPIPARERVRMPPNMTILAHPL
jgi:hypothetical protein